jgi:hypothetical protein
MFPLPLSLGFESECEIMDFNINDDDLPSVIKSGQREKAGMTAPANGLALLKVNY